MFSDRFCGHEGARTIFSVTPNGSAWHIHPFSFYGTDESEVLFLPLSLMNVKLVQKRRDPNFRIPGSKGGFPDEVELEQMIHPVFCFDEKMKAKAKQTQVDVD